MHCTLQYTVTASSNKTPATVMSIFTMKTKNQTPIQHTMAIWSLYHLSQKNEIKYCTSKLTVKANYNFFFSSPIKNVHVCWQMPCLFLPLNTTLFRWNPCFDISIALNQNSRRVKLKQAEFTLASVRAEHSHCGNCSQLFELVYVQQRWAIYRKVCVS